MGNDFFIPLLYVLSGIAAYAAITHFFAGLHATSSRQHLIFATLCIAVSLNGIIHAQVLQASSIADFVFALRIHLAVIITVLILLCWFMVEYTEVRPLRFLIPLNLVLVAMYFVNLLQPYSLQYEHISAINAVKLPWGEIIYRAAGSNGIWFKIAVTAVFALFAYCIHALIAMYRRGQRNSALFMQFGIGVLIACAIEGILVRMAAIDFVELGPLGYLAMILVMSMVLNYELNQKGQRFQLLLDHLPAVIYLKDPQGHYLMVNRQYEQILRHNRSEILGRSDEAFLPPERSTLVREKEQRAIADASLLKFEEIIVLEGKPHNFLSMKFPLYNADGSASAICNISTDVTELKQAEAELTKSERKFRMLYADVEKQVAERTLELGGIVASVLESIITVNVHGMIESINPAGEALFGYRAEELNKRHISALIPDFFAVMQAPGKRRDTTAMRKDYLPIPIELAISTLQLPERKIYTAIIHDLTERLRINRMKDEFISMISHELRTPLTSIRGSLGLITGGTLGNIPDAIRDMLRIALNNSERLGGIIDDILDIEKLELGKVSMELQPCRLHDLLNHAMTHNQAFAQQYQIKLRLIEPLDSTVRVNVDEARFQQVMNNLLSNAVKFSTAGGTVEILTDIIDGNARILVKDHGCGIPEEFRPRIFQKFSQADSSDTRRGSGSGLGLCIVKCIVEQMGGRISYTSEPGQGSTFYFDLPLIQD